MKLQTSIVDTAPAIPRGAGTTGSAAALAGVVCILALALHPGGALAAPAINLFWNDCGYGGGNSVRVVDTASWQTMWSWKAVSGTVDRIQWIHESPVLTTIRARVFQGPNTTETFDIARRAGRDVVALPAPRMDHFDKVSLQADYWVGPRRLAQSGWSTLVWWPNAANGLVRTTRATTY